MQKISLLIQPEIVNNFEIQKYVYVDLMEEELITLTQVIQDVKDIDKIFTDFSRTFNLPASKTNNKLFKNWHNPSVIGFNNQTMSNAKIELNHSEFKSGKIRLENVVMKNNKPSIYKVTFFGNTVSLTDLMQEDELDTLSWLDNFNVTQTATNVSNGLKDGLDFTVDSVSYTDAVIFPLLTHSQRYMINETGDFDNVGNISFRPTSSLNYNRVGILPEDLKPAIKVSLIIKAIEVRYGLKFKTSEFFDSPAVTNMYLWMHRDKGKMALAGTWLGNSDSYSCSGDCASLGSFTNPYGGVQTSTGIIRYKNMANFNSSFLQIQYINDTGTITVEVIPATGFETVNYDIDILDYVIMNPLVSIQSVQGTQSLVLNIGGSNGIDNTVGYGNRNNREFIGRVNSSSSFQFQFKITYNRRFVADSTNSGSQSVTNQTAVFTSTSSSLTPTGGLIVMTEQMPKMKVIDFLKGLFKMHNLTAFINIDNELVVKTLDSYYASGNTLDLTEYIDTDQHTIESTLPFSEVKFEYPEPKTVLAQEFLNQNNRRFGSLDYFSEGSTTKKYEIKAPFEHMMFERLKFESNNVLTDIQYGLFIDDELNPTIGAPLLFYATNCDMDDDFHFGPNSINFVDSTRPSNGGLPSAGTRIVIPTAWMPANTFSTGGVHPLFNKPTFETHFGNEINSFTLTNYSGNTNSLFELYYKNYITRIYDVKTRLYKYKAILPLGILLKLSLDDKIIVGTKIYTINKMTTKLQSGETELELLSQAYD